MNPYVFIQPDVDPPRPQPERSLWLAVVEMAAVECFAPRCVYEKNAADKAFWLQRYARHWIFHSPDFPAVCELAGVEPGFVRRLVAQRIIASEKRPRGHLRQVRS